MAQNGQLGFECIVAHFNEDLTWLEEIAPDTIIYSKGNKPASGNWKEVRELPNIGREGHTYLHHLITHYDTIADVTMFIQGDAYNPDGRTPPHSTLDVPGMKAHAIKNNATGFTCFTPVIGHFDQWSGLPWESNVKFRWWMHKNGKGMLRAQLTPAEFWAEYIGGPHPECIWFASGAFFAVTRDAVHARPKSFYEKLMKGAFTDSGHINPEYGHFVERFWGSIFLDIEGDLESRRGSLGSDSEASRTSEESEMLTSRSKILLDIAETVPPLPISQEEFGKKRDEWMRIEMAEEVAAGTFVV